ncbi:MAG: SRPBCC family protein [Pseudomonadota bacterium]
MFGFNKKRRLIEGPVEFTAEVQIDRPAAEVFPLLDIADPRFSHVQRGAEVRSVDADGTQFEMSVEEFDDAVFTFKVVHRENGARLTFETSMEPQQNALVEAVEDYSIEALGDEACHVRVATTATFGEDLSDEEVAGEIAVMSAAVTGDLEKLKVLAEEGVEAVIALEEEEFGFDFQLDGINIEWDDIEPEQ